MAMHPDIAKHLDEIRNIAERYGVDRLEVFGSAMTDAFDPARSDVDFVVHYPEGYSFGPFGKRLFDLEDTIAEILGRPADLVMTSALTNDSFRRNADRTRITIYESSGLETGNNRLAETLPTSR